jgi:hypothetical protein
MMYGSMTHTACGRKRNTQGAYKTRTKRMSDYDWKQTSLSVETPRPFVRGTDEITYPSAPLSVLGGTEKNKQQLSTQERIKISSQYTIAPSYNKGAYMVVPRNEVECIGK